MGVVALLYMPSSIGLDMEKEAIVKAMKGMDKSIQETRQKAYDKISAEVMKTDMKQSSKIVTVWALAKYFNIEIDIYETKEKWI